MTQRNFHYADKVPLSEPELLEYLAPYVPKFVWFKDHGYEPHYFQQLFHAMHNDEGKILKFRHLSAGRRGGKTLSAAWEIMYYMLHPEFFHWDVHKEKSNRPLYGWVLFKDNPTGLASWTVFKDVIRELGLQQGKEVRVNQTNHWIEFENGGFLHFRTAEDPESLRGAGLDFMWIDEAAHIPNERAWVVARPALSDKEGIVITTTTPIGKNWFYTKFFHDSVREDPAHGRVEYRSIDNPYYPKSEWEALTKEMHPMVFRQEMMAAFDAFEGRELLADWLKYYTLGEPDQDKIEVPRSKDDPKKFNLDLFMGVDPAISLSDTADSFAMALIGVSKDRSQVFLLDTFKGKIPFPEQVDKIKEWHVKYKPYLIGIEANAYQAALAQQVARLEGFIPGAPIFNTGRKKSERILGMAPLFRIGKVRIRQDQRDFIDEWLDYDSTIKNPHDDLLDAVEIALGSAGALLPELPRADWFKEDLPVTDMNEWAKRDLPQNYRREDYGFFDEHMGADY